MKYYTIMQNSTDTQVKMNYKDIIKILMKCTKLQYSLMKRITMSGNLNLLKWAQANGCNWNTWTCSVAALKGHLNVLNWARTNDCDWISWTCTYASWKGHLDIKMGSCK